MNNNNPFDCKYIWGHRNLEEELKKIKQRIKEQRGIDLPVSNLTHILAEDLKMGNIVINPEIIRFRKRKMLRVGNTNVKVK